jgi:hypothetical protein
VGYRLWSAASWYVLPCPQQCPLLVLVLLVLVLLCGCC